MMLEHAHPSRLLYVWLMVACPATGFAQPQSDETRFAREVVPFFLEFCVDCHSGGDAASGGLDLEAYESFDSVLQHRSHWDHLRELIDQKSMPPEDHEPQPTEEERAAVLQCMEALLTPSCDGDADPGQVTLRRLSNFEYDNTVRDLLGVRFRPSLECGFPPDEVASGFENQGDAMSISPLRFERYLESARRIATHVLEHAKRRRMIVEHEPTESLAPSDALRKAFAQFLPRAYRRPIEPIELQHAVDLGERVLSSGGSFEEAVSTSLQAVLVSPHFLFRVERPTGDDFLEQHNDREAIEPYALATRLSYFLWSSMPDTALIDAAAAGRLRDEQDLREQIERMLADKKSRALVDSFLHHWLGLDQIYASQPDARRFPLWTSRLRDAMVEQTERSFARVLQENQPLIHLLLGEQLDINPRLAELYGVDFEGEDPFELFVRGAKNEQEARRRRTGRNRHPPYADETKWIRIPAPANRFGLLTHASVLTLTSNATDTSPVKRGKWVLEALLGDPPPPAPPAVPSLEESAAQVRHLSLREQLAVHRSDPNCASCHVKMDPIGLALQNYDPIGRWRDDEQGKPVDASGELEGVTFSGPAELAELIVSREEAIASNFVRRLLCYALGRSLVVDDECAVDAILQSTRADRYPLQSLVAGVVLSEPFRMRRSTVQP